MRKDIEQKSINKVIIILAILLVLSITALAVTVASKYSSEKNGNSAIVSDNVITPEKANIIVPKIHNLAVIGGKGKVEFCKVQKVLADSDNGKEVTLKIYKYHAEDEIPFQVTNMFPGDSETRAYLLEVSYRGNITVHFKANIKPGYEKLAEVLKCKVAIRGGATLYDGLMKDMPDSVDYNLPVGNGGTDEFIYDITVYLDTSVGNEYMSKQLYADFVWWVNEDESSSSSSSDSSSSSSSGIVPIIPSGSSSSGSNSGVTDIIPGGLCPPNTGYIPRTALWASLAVVSLLIVALLLLILLKKKKGDKDDE